MKKSRDRQKPRPAAPSIAPYGRTVMSTSWNRLSLSGSSSKLFFTGGHTERTDLFIADTERADLFTDGSSRDSVRFGAKVGQIVTKSGNFEDHISIYFGTVSQNVLKNDL